jgi:hypothetical protein
MDFPITLRFKTLALAPQIYVTDAAGRTVLYVKQKLFRLKEKVQCFQDDSRQAELYQIAADRVIDFNAVYHFATPDGQRFGGLRRKGMRSLWRAHYEIMNTEGQVIYDVREEKPMLRLLDGLVGQVPILGMFTGYLVHPSYLISTAGGGPPVFRLQKQPAFWEGKFTLQRLGPPAAAEDDIRMVLACMMFTLLERSRA